MGLTRLVPKFLKKRPRVELIRSICACCYVLGSSLAESGYLIWLVHSTDLFQFGKWETFFFFYNSWCWNVDMLSQSGCSTSDKPKLYTHLQWRELMRLGLRPSALPFHCRGLGEIHFPVESVEAVKWLMAEWKAVSTSPWPLTPWEHPVAPLAACLTTFPRRKSAAVLRRTRKGQGRSRDVRLSWRNPSEGRPHWVERSQTTTNLLITAGQSRFVKAKVVA